MRCNRVVEGYFRYEDFYHAPFFLKVHIIFCADCRREIFRLNRVFRAMNNDSIYKSPYDLNSSIMNIIRNESVYNEKSISGIKWVLIGSVIFVSILLINFSDSFLWMKKEFGSDFTIPLSIVLGLVFSAYSAVVVGCNYEEIKKYIDLHSRWRFK